MKKFILSLAVFCLLFSGCQTDSLGPGYSDDFGPYWDLPIDDSGESLVNDSSLTHHYGLEIIVSNGVVTGSVELIDSVSRNIGILNGTKNGNLIILNAVFTAIQYNFEFTGTKTDNIIAGKFIFKNPLSDTLDVTLLSANKKVFDFGTAPPPNPYMLKTIFTTPNPTGPPVVFVHGMGATIAEWNSLLNSLDANFKSRHNVYCYQYNWQDSIMINGRILKDSIIAKGLVNPILIAHSMGGLVSRAYIANGGQITKLITLGTPHRGTELVKLLFVVPSLNTPGPQDMNTSGGFIQNMLINTLDLQNRNKYYCIAGEMGGHFQYLPLPVRWVWNETYYKDVMNGIVCTGWKLLKPFGPNDGLVNVTSALFYDGSGVNLPFPSSQLYIDHMHLVTPVQAPLIFNYIKNL